MSDFTPLHLHTHFSIGGGPASPRDWCRTASKLGYRSIGAVERGPLAGMPAFLKAAREAGLEAAYGLELGVLLPVGGGAGKRSILLFPSSSLGSGNIARLAALAYKEWPAKEEAVPWAALVEHANGLVLVLPADIEAESGASALESIATLAPEIKQHFAGAAFLGLPTPTEGYADLAASIAKAAEQTGLPLVALPTARYLRAEDKQAYTALKLARARAGWTQAAPVSASAQAEHLLSPAEAEELFSRYPGAIENTARIAQLCAGHHKTEVAQSNAALRSMLRETASARLQHLPAAETQERLDLELEAFEKGNQLPAWQALATLGIGLGEKRPGEHRIPLGAPLGTADGALLGFALGISPLDPRPYPLPRWLHSADEALTLPMPSISVPGGAREALLKEIAGRYGQNGAALAACQMDIDPVLAVWAATQVTATGPNEARALALETYAGGWAALDGKTAPAAALAHSLCGAPATFKPDLETLLIPEEGAGLPEWAPLLGRSGSPAWVPWSEEAVAFMKLPALSLRPSPALDTLNAALNLAMQYPVPHLLIEEADTTALPNLSKEAAQRIAQGELVGIPYISASAVKGWKGDIDADSIPALLARSLYSGKAPVAPKLDLWAAHTKETDGSLLYHDQFETLLAVAAGFSSSDAATLRGALLKKDEAAVALHKATFIEGCGGQGIDSEGAESLWQALCGSLPALQSRHVIAAHTRTVMWAAHLRAEHPAAFVAALLNGVAESREGTTWTVVPSIAAEARKSGVKLKRPDASYSRVQASLELEGTGWVLLWGLAMLPGWGIEEAQRFVDRRPRGGFSGLSDLVQAAYGAGLNKSHLESLVRAGGCDTLGGRARSRDALLGAIPAWLDWSQANHAEHSAPRDMFSLSDTPSNDVPDESLTYGSSLSPRERYILRDWEKAHLGLGFTDASEIDALNYALDTAGDLRSKLTGIVHLEDEQPGSSVSIIGLLTTVAQLTPPPSDGNPAKNGKNMPDPLATAWIEDAEGAIELVAFPPSYKRHAALWTEGKLVVVTGRVSKHANGDTYLLCEHLAPFYSEVEEEELVIKIKTGAKKAPAQAEDKTASAANGHAGYPSTAGAPIYAAKSSPATGAVNGSNGNNVSNGNNGNNGNNGSNGNHQGVSPMTLPSVPLNPAATTTIPTAPTAPTAPTMTNSTNMSAPGTDGGTPSYKLVITLPGSPDEQADIDLMIALKQLLQEHTGPDTITLRLPYIPETGTYTSAQLPRGVLYSALLEADVVRLLGRDAMAVIKL